jgi:tetratricopeptide (TPR) repeat protein/transcriptional regulator with XRE-family HTH domain
MSNGAARTGAARRARLAQRRKAVGLTQEQLAGQLGVERTTVVRWERGETHPLPWLLPRLAKALGVSAESIEELLAAAEPRPDARAAVPRQLPAAIPDFTGRATELEALTRMLDRAGTGAPGTVVISAIGGTAGVGKTALALHWAHQVAARLPDGQLYVNLRGFDPSGTPAAPEAAIRVILDALGVPPERIPPVPEAQAGLYRSLLAGRRMLIVADNARDERQVRPLLPASPGSLALAVAAARAAARPGFPLAALAAELADSADRLDALDADDPAASVRAVFSWSYRQLSGEAARMFGLLGLHTGPDISVPAAASLADRDQPQARRLLRELARAHLIAEHVPGRYAFHDLLRAYAAEQAHQAGSKADRDAATGRVLDHYLHSAAAAARLLNPAMELVALVPLRRGAAVEQPADYPQALAWFEAERQVLLAALALAAGSGLDTDAWQLSWALAPFRRIRGHWQEGAATQCTALAAATRLGDATAQAVSSRLLALACTKLGDHDKARGHYASSLTLYRRLGNRLGEAKVHQSLGWLAEDQGRYADALGHAEQALRLYQAIGDKANEAGMLNNVGWCHGLLGDYQQAHTFCRQALTLNAEAGYRWLEGYIWDSLGYAEHHLGNLAEAATCYRRALSLHRVVGHRHYEATTLTHLGDTRHAMGELAQAREVWQQALAILEDLQHPDADQVRAKLASTTDQVSRTPSG